MAKDILFVKIGGQSNFGTDPNMGRVNFSDMPSHLRQPYTNVFFWDIALAADYNFRPYVPVDGRQMGQLDQFLYRMSQRYDKIYCAKRAVGGKTIGPSDSEYPRDDFKNRVSAAKAALDALEGESSYDKLMLWCLCESDSIYEANALIFDEYEEEWYVEARLATGYSPIIARQIGSNQTDFEFREITRGKQQDVADRSIDAYTFDSSRMSLHEGGDLSHFDAVGSIVGGNKRADIAENILNVFSSKVRPRVLSAVVEDANPNQIILTLNKNLNEVAIPYLLDFTTSPAKTISAIAISGKVVTITTASDFQASDVITLSHTKGGFDGAGMQDYNGNSAANFTNMAVTNNVTKSVSLTSGPPSDFTTADGWTGQNGAVLLANQSIGGEDACLKYTTDGLDYAYKGFAYTYGQKYRVTMKMYWERLCNKKDDVVSIQSIHEPFFNIAKLVRPHNINTWIDVEFEFTPTTSSQLRIQVSSSNKRTLEGASFYIKDVIISTVNEM
jgi:hypothetical protein